MGRPSLLATICLVLACSPELNTGECDRDDHCTALGAGLVCQAGLCVRPATAPAPDAAAAEPADAAIDPPDGAAPAPTGVTLYVVNTNDALTSYADAARAEGAREPTTRLAQGAATSLFQPRAVVITRSGRLLVARQNGGIVGWNDARAADGETPAELVVEGAATGLGSPVALAYDAAADRLFVGMPRATMGVLVFDAVSEAAFDGEIAPSRAFAPPDRAPHDTVEMNIDALALDAAGNLWVADTSGLSANHSRVLVFADPGAAEGSAAPVRTLTTEAWGVLAGIALHDDRFYALDGGDELYLVESASTADGIVAPSAVTITGDRVALGGIAVAADGTVFLSDAQNAAILTFDGLGPGTASAAPDRVVVGFPTRLRGPRTLFLMEP